MTGENDTRLRRRLPLLPVRFERQEYLVVLDEVANGLCTVNFRYGRRGSTLMCGAKTMQPIEQSKARKLFDKLVAEMTAKAVFGR